MNRPIEEIEADIRRITVNLGGSFPVLDDYYDELRGAITSGIPLPRLKEICAAERDGRYWIAPCKVGDTVYCIFKDGKVHRGFVSGYQIGCRTGTHYCIINDGLDDESDFQLFCTLDDFGKTVFLTHESAKSASEAKNDKL